MNTKLLLSFILLFGLLAFPLKSAGSAINPTTLQNQTGDIASLSVTNAGLVWQPRVEAAAWHLRVAYPGGETFEDFFAPGEEVAFSLTDAAGSPLQDGVYTYEVWGEPPISSEARSRLEAAQGFEERQALVEELQKEGKLPAGPFYMEGIFAIRKGQAYIPDPLASERPWAPAEPLAPNDQVIADDLIVQGNACIGRASYGTNCADGMTWTISPLMISDLHARIFFEDTSAITNPTNDWAILINDNYTGGANYFAIQDEDGGTVPFKIRAGAPDNAIYVNASGYLGLGTATPDANLQITSAINPVLSLEQTAPAQVWELVGNSMAFTIYDRTAMHWPVEIQAGSPSNSIYVDSAGYVGLGTSVPDSRLTVTGDVHAGGFRVESGAPANSLFLTNSGLVGIGTNLPGAKLHVMAGATSFPFLVDNGASANNLYVTSLGNVGIGTAFPGAKLHVNGSMRAAGFIVEAGSPVNSLYVDSTSNVGVGTDAPAEKLHVNGNLRVEGFINERSDRAAKTAFAAVDGQEVLEKLSSVPITTWSYKDSPDVRHMGPMAQDFRAAYGVGPDDKHLAALDTNGVALAAIQALDAQAKELKAQNQELQARIKALEARQGASPWSQLTPFVFGLLGMLAGSAITRKKKA